MKKIFTVDAIESIAALVLEKAVPQQDRATVVTLSGDLGAGKTTLTQMIGKKLGIKENMISPTFVIMKLYPLQGQAFHTLIHIDAYRLNSGEELSKLRFDEYCGDPGNLIIIEWPERVATCIPPHAIACVLEHLTDDTRAITV